MIDCLRVVLSHSMSILGAGSILWPTKIEIAK
jgi:hypothetical protein